MRGKCRDFRIYGNRFAKFSRAGIELNGDNGSILGEPVGVIFENEFIDNWSPYLGYGVAVNGSATAWSQPLSLGSGQAVFVEDNYFEANRCAIQANNGARYVFRHNRISNNRGTWLRFTRTVKALGPVVRGVTKSTIMNCEMISRGGLELPSGVELGSSLAMIWMACPMGLSLW